MLKLSPPNPIFFGKRLAWLRKLAGYTQQELARKLGISRAKIAYYEAQAELPVTALLREFALALNVSADELLGLRQCAVPPQDENQLQHIFRQIKALSVNEQRQLMLMIDALLRRERT